MPAIMNHPAHLLAMLQSHALTHGELHCHILPDRVITYRRLWSRIERASARLQGEWGIGSGHTVAYVGSGHPDAIVLYAALLRIGARLLALEGLATPAISALLAATQTSLVVADEDHAPLPRGVAVKSLSLLLADWCYADPLCVAEDPDAPSLLLPVQASCGGELNVAQPPGIQAWSLRQLTASLPERPSTLQVSSALFTAEVLSGSVLPALRDAQILHFSSIEQSPSDD